MSDKSVSTTDTTVSLEQQVARLNAVVAYLATELDFLREQVHFGLTGYDERGPKMCSEEVIERTLYAEHFMGTTT